MKDEKPAKKMVPREVAEEFFAEPPAPTKWAAPVEPAVVAPEPVQEATLPTGTHFDNQKKNRRPGKA